LLCFSSAGYLLLQCIVAELQDRNGGVITIWAFEKVYKHAQRHNIFMQSRSMDVAIKYGIHILQLLGILIVGVTALRLFFVFAQHKFSTRNGILFVIRSRYVQGLLLAFDILVAAGILTTILHPSWSDIGRLAAIAALRMLIKKALNMGIKRNQTEPQMREDAA
jgi:uncharacterized membrane protein